MKPLISVLVTVYNIESFIDYCITSIIKQTYKNLEIIIVNDGSIDGSGEICKGYQNTDSRIIVIDQENKGISEARNAALDRCTGDFLVFIDGDDAIADDYIEKLYNDIVSNEADISVCSWSNISEGQKPQRQNCPDDVLLMSRQEAMENMLYQNSFDSSAWGKLYRSSLFSSLRFPTGKIYEDILISYLLFDGADKISFRDYKAYYYTIRETGIIKSVFNDKKMDLISEADKVMAFVRGKYPELTTAAMSRVIRADLHIYLQIPSGMQFSAQRKLIENNIRQYRKSVMRDRKAKRGTKIALLITCLSFRLLYHFRKLNKLGKR